MIRLGLLGFGSHSRRLHVPALERLLREYPERLTLAAVCDRDSAAAAAAAARFPGAACYRELAAMLDGTGPDAVIAITPARATPEVAAELARRRLPALIEKPLAADCAAAEELCALIARVGAPVMVSANRRFQPLVRRAAALLAGQRVTYARATILRHDRPGPGFFADAVFHPVDTLRCLLGEVVAHEIRPWAGRVGEAGIGLFHLVGGALAVLEADPLSARWAESIDFFGEGFELSLELGHGLRLWERGRPVLAETLDPGLPHEVRDGTYGETVAFLEACEGLRPFAPSPDDALRTMRLLDFPSVRPSPP